MLREYQDEIKRLKEQLEANQRGVMIDETGKVGTVVDHNATFLFYVCGCEGGQLLLFYNCVWTVYLVYLPLSPLLACLTPRAYALPNGSIRSIFFPLNYRYHCYLHTRRKSKCITRNKK